MSSPLLSVENITKAFPGGVIALDNVSMNFQPGEFTVILGENGAGKSTLVKILYGIYTPDKGSIILKGKPVEIKSSLDAIKMGIVMVSQIPQLIDRLTVVENISLSLTSIGMFETMTRVRRFFKEVGEKIGIKVNPDAKVWSLTYTQKQLIEITRAILLDAMVLILDEALTYLPMEERRKFYVYLNEFKEKGRSVILITHKIPEALEIAD
ncbi:MAG: ATP-binding cassette domain-containing protein, partial [Thermosphaera sp.]|nr:ATP-binding cassette domain-containing protein [Thermosphaera sp.]